MSAEGVTIESGHLVIGGQVFPTAVVTTSDLDYPPTLGGSYHHRSAKLHFENGWTLSMVWGSGTYSTNRDAGFRGGEMQEVAATCEIAAWWGPTPDAADPYWLTFEEGDTVKGWVGAAELLAFIDELAVRPSARPQWEAGHR